MKTKCHNCEKTIVARGGKPKTGVWFCKALPCRAAKERHDRRWRRGEEEGRIEDRRCSCCGIELLTRPWRVTDLEEGRWCRRTKCQEQRGLVLRARAGTVDDAEVAHAMFITARARGWVYCDECNQQFGVAGFPHPKPDWKAPCFAFGNRPVEESLTRMTWPEIFYAPETFELKNALERMYDNGLRERP